MNKDRFSEEMISFLCGLLKSDPSQRPSVKELLEHPWLRASKRAIKGVNVSLKELLSVHSPKQNGWLFQNVPQQTGVSGIPTDFQERQLESLANAISVLPCFEEHRIKINKPNLRELADELGIPERKVFMVFQDYVAQESPEGKSKHNRGMNRFREEQHSHAVINTSYNAE